jgi:hypothetical protein
VRALPPVGSFNRGRPLSAIAALIGCWVIGRAGYIAVNFPDAIALKAPSVKMANGEGSAPTDIAFKTLEQWLIGNAFAARGDEETLKPRRRLADPFNSTKSRQPPVAQQPPLRPVTVRTTPFRIPNVTQTHILSPPQNPKSNVQPVITPPVLWPQPAARSGTRSGNGTRNRLSLSAWMLWRPNLRQEANPSPLQLGGSQLGARLNYDVRRVGKTSNVNGYARFVMPIGQTSNKEAALGISVKRGKTVPVEIAVERRFAVTTGGKNAWSAFASSGVSDVPLGPRFSANGYAQAGIVGLRDRATFIDGEMSLMHPLAHLGKTSVQIGGVMAGSAQKSVNRFDLGPVITLRPKIGKQAIRVSASWRFRVAGNAEPRSGFALSIGGDF